MDKETSEIAKLTGRISKDPKSKLFVPLAEEYKKAGDIDMAIHVLLEGLKSNPDYVTARSSLGKLLFAKGDLAGAQKEFEAVVKNVPDNMMAQKKLGDLFVLQKRTPDALPHYKIALTLNPADEELASLISDLEAGRDIGEKVQASKVKTTAEPAVKHEPPASAAVPGPAPGPVPPQTSNVEQKIIVETPLVSQTRSPVPSREKAPAPASSATEPEEAEDVLVVEPLEPEASVQIPQAASSVLLEATEIGVVPSVVTEKSFDFDLSAGNQLPDEPVVSPDIRPGTELFTGEDGGSIPTGVSEEIKADELVGTGFDEEIVEKIPETSFKDISGKSDDFTTDTLAELYISQGFFEKAVEIYERMLIDKPNSRGLQDKLSWVRSAVAGTVTPSSEQKNEADIYSSPETREYIPAAESGEFMGEPLEEHRPQQAEDTSGFIPAAVTEARVSVPSVEPEEMFIDAEVVAESGDLEPEIKSSEVNSVAESSTYQHSPGPKDKTTAGGGEGFTVLTDASIQAQVADKKDFEPREYVPPDREQKAKESLFHDDEHETNVSPSDGRKATIARLETWLTTIKKEK